MKSILFFLYLLLLFMPAFPLYAQYAHNPELWQPGSDSLTQYPSGSTQVLLRHSDRTFGNKMLRAGAYSLGYNAVIMTALILSPEYISLWDKQTAFTKESLKAEYKRTFTTAPQMDKDLFIINYVGHPYQGSFYYNATRSQGPNMASLLVYRIAGNTLGIPLGRRPGAAQCSGFDYYSSGRHYFGRAGSQSHSGYEPKRVHLVRNHCYVRHQPRLRRQQRI